MWGPFLVGAITEIHIYWALFFWGGPAELTHAKDPHEVCFFCDEETAKQHQCSDCTYMLCKDRSCPHRCRFCEHDAEARPAGQESTKLGVVRCKRDQVSQYHAPHGECISELVFSSDFRLEGIVSTRASRLPVHLQEKVNHVMQITLIYLD